MYLSLWIYKEQCFAMVQKENIGMHQDAHDKNAIISLMF